MSTISGYELGWIDSRCSVKKSTPSVYCC